MAISAEFIINKKNKEVIAQIKRTEQITKNALRKSFYAIGKELTKEAKRSIIEGPKTGRLYRIKGRKRRHRASAPGEPPATLSGDLQKSVDFLVQGWSQMTFGAGSQEIDYAKFLELGTVGGKIAPRPYLIRAIEQKEKQTRTIFEANLKKGLRK